MFVAIGPFVWHSTPVTAQVVALDQGQSIEDKRSGWIPYAFATDSLGTAAGLAGFRSAPRQPQANMFGTAFASTNESWAVVGSLGNLRAPATDRWFIDVFAMAGHFTDSRFYVDLDKDPAEPRAGSNESDADDFVTGISNDVQFDLTLKHPLAIGGARDDPVSVFRLNQGMLESGPAGAERWNPLVSGKTTLSLQFFARYRDLREVSDPELLFAETNGLEARIDYDNTDFSRNPTRGSRQRFAVARDFGWFDSSNSWTSLEMELTKYLDLGTTNWFRQRVLAADFWTSYSPTWTADPENPTVISNRPPAYKGATLGGYDRLRAYPVGRFNDKAAVYYSAELRMTPRTNPLRDVPVLDYFEIDFWQLVGFVEAGRVGPSYNFDLFHEDLRFSAGADLRLMAFRNVVRVGVAWSDEGSQIWAMFEQTFARR